MQRHRGILTVVGLTALAIVSAVVALEIHHRLTSLPDLETADEAGLVRWLVLADLSEHSTATQRRLVERLETSFGGGNVDASAAQELDATYRQRLEKNALLLRKLWFFDQIDHYATTTPEQRISFLDRQIAAIERWAALEQSLTRPAGDAAVGKADQPDVAAWLTDFFTAIDGWSDGLDRARAERMWSGVKAGLIRWLGTYDLADTTLDVRRRLARGLESHIGGNLQLAGVTSGFSATEEKRFWQNVERIAHAWFVDRAEVSAKLAPADRTKFIASQSKLLGQFLPFVEKLGVGMSAAAASGSAKYIQATPVSVRVGQWIDGAPSEERPALRQFAEQIQGALLWQKVQLWIRVK